MILTHIHASMGLLIDAVRAYGTAVKRAFPLLVVVTVILDALLLRYVEPAPPIVIGFWLGVYVGGTFLIVTALYVSWLYITRSVDRHTPTESETAR